MCVSYMPGRSWKEVDASLSHWCNIDVFRCTKSENAAVYDDPVSCWWSHSLYYEKHLDQDKLTNHLLGGE